jgi:hypothetical protein
MCVFWPFFGLPFCLSFVCWFPPSIFIGFFCPHLCLLLQHQREIVYKGKGTSWRFFLDVGGLSRAKKLEAWLEFRKSPKGIPLFLPQCKELLKFWESFLHTCQAGILGFCKIPKILQTWSSPRGGVFKYKGEILKDLYTWVSIHVKILFPLNE